MCDVFVTHSSTRRGRGCGLTRESFRPWLLAVAIATLAGAPVAMAGPEGAGEILAPAPGQAIRAGERVEVSWARVPADVEEFELLLSIDGGETFPLRLTEMLDPALVTYAWRVPNLPTRAARLRLRAGVRGHEVMLRPGPAFEICGEAGAPAGRITFRRGEWWPTEGVAVLPQDVETEPRWSSEGTGDNGPVATAEVPPERPGLGAPASAPRVGNRDESPSPTRCGPLPREDRAATSFPKRE